jgi:UDP-N-acetylmuramyl pentapeptide phosphotransferase/UDP-N-acetylglucosamine-1-phosphate transferase
MLRMVELTAIVLVSIASVVLAVVVVPIARRMALAKGLLDIPNERSSHKTPTPRTGGIGIFAGAIGGLGLALAVEAPTPNCAQWLFFGSLLAGAVAGFMDDVFSLPTAVRMLLYLACAAGLAYCGASVETIALPGLPSFGIGHVGGLAFSALFIAWYTNLFNFMDGIDGIAGTAAAVTMGFLAIVFLSNDDAMWGILSLCCASACVGFLLHNYPPASVFMGDGGAVFLGLAAGGLSLVAIKEEYLELPAAVLLMFPFVFDATFTLLRRMIKRERFWAAHRTHIYQQMCDLGFSHRSVTTIYTAAAVIFATLGVSYGEIPPWGQGVAWWGSILLGLVLAMLVVVKNGRSSSNKIRGQTEAGPQRPCPSGKHARGQ